MFAKKTWADRIAEFITRRTLTYEDNSTAVVTVERNEGEVSQVGDAFSAQNMNDLEDRIYDAFEEINTNLTANNKPFKFGYQGGKYGFIIDNMFQSFKTAHTGTFSPTTKGVADMGEDHNYRYVNTNNIQFVERVYSGYGTSVNFGYTTDANRVYVAYVSAGGTFTVSNTGVSFGDNYRAYVVIIFTSNAVHKVINGSVSLGVRESDAVSLGGTYDTTKIGVSLSMGQFHVTALSGTAVTLYNADNGYRLSTSYSIVIFK